MLKSAFLYSFRLLKQIVVIINIMLKGRFQLLNNARNFNDRHLLGGAISVALTIFQLRHIALYLNILLPCKKERREMNRIITLIGSLASQLFPYFMFHKYFIKMTHILEGLRSLEINDDALCPNSPVMVCSVWFIKG